MPFSPVKGPPGMARIMKKVRVMTTNNVNKLVQILWKMYFRIVRDPPHP